MAEAPAAARANERRGYALSFRRYPSGRACATAALALALALALGLTACGGRSAAPGQVVRITERDFRIRAPHELRAGPVRFVVANHGPASHELIVVRTTDRRLPLRKDGLTVDEQALLPNTVGVLEPAGPGSRTLDVRLRPGRYVVFCNMAGHYLSGMWAVIRVVR